MIDSNRELGLKPQARTSEFWQNARIVGRIREVDGLRGLAILLILFFHYVTAIGAPRHRLWGVVTASTSLFWSGVDLFFVLSGFLIAGILIDSANSPRFFQTFYMRRFHRIFPLYFGWFALFCLGLYFEVDYRLQSDLFSASVPLWFYPLFIQNNAPLLLNTKLPLWMAMSWSLAVEEQFYLVLPTIVRFASKRTLAWLATLVLVLSPIYRFTLVTGHPNLNPGWPFATLSRLDGLAAGVCAALLVRNEKCWMYLNRYRMTLRVILAFLLCGFAVITYSTPPLKWMALFGFTVIAPCTLLVCWL